MTNQENIQFIDNPATREQNSQYVEVIINVPAVLDSWRLSIFSYEWLGTDGAIKPASQLSENEQPKRLAVEEKLKSTQPIEKPILGIGIQDNVEIGSGRAELLTLAAHGVKTMPVHIRKSNERDFKAFLADVNS
jgi:hypothetical protein